MLFRRRHAPEFKCQTDRRRDCAAPEVKLAAAARSCFVTTAVP